MLSTQLIKTVRSKVVQMITSKNASSAIWSSADAVVYPVLMLMATPYFIDKLGADLYGIWMLVNTVIASIGILNVGFGDATIKYVAQYEAKQDRAGAKRIVETTFLIYLILSVIVGLVSLALAFLIEKDLVFQIVGSYKSIAVLIIPIAGVTLGLKFIEQIFLATFKGYHKYDVSARISMCVKFVTILTNVLMVYLGYSLLAIFVGTLVISFLFLVYEGYRVSQFFDSGFFNLKFESRYVKEVFSFGIWTWSLSILGLVSSQIDKYLVVALSDLKVFAFYSIAVTIFNQIHNLFSASVSWIFPVVSGKIHRNEDINPLYKKLQWAFLSFACVSLTLFFMFKGPFLLYWLGPVNYAATDPFINLFICFNFIMAGTILPYYFLNGSGYFRLNTYFNIANVVARLVLMPLMFSFFGTEGLVLGLIASGIMVIPFQMNFFYRKVLGEKGYFPGFVFIVPFCVFLLLLMWSNPWLNLLLMAMVLLYLAVLFKPKFNVTS